MGTSITGLKGRHVRERQSRHPSLCPLSRASGIAPAGGGGTHPWLTSSNTVGKRKGGMITLGNGNSAFLPTVPTSQPPPETPQSRDTNTGTQSPAPLSPHERPGVRFLMFPGPQPGCTSKSSKPPQKHSKETGNRWGQLTGLLSTHNSECPGTRLMLNHQV